MLSTRLMTRHAVSEENQTPPDRSGGQEVDGGRRPDAACRRSTGSSDKTASAPHSAGGMDAEEPEDQSAERALDEIYDDRSLADGRLATVNPIVMPATALFAAESHPPDHSGEITAIPEQED